MGQIQSKFCGGDQSFDKDINEHLPQFKKIMENVQSSKLINERFPSFKKESEKSFNQLKDYCYNSVVKQQSICQKKLQNIKDSLSLKYGGNLKQFQKKKGCTVEKYLNSDKDLKEFDKFKDRVKSQFQSKKQFLLSTLETQKNLYISELNKSTPNSVTYQGYTVDQQEKLFQRFMKGDSERAKDIQNKAEKQYSNFLNKMAIPLLKQNLCNLTAEKECQDHLAKVQSHWNSLIQSAE